MIIAFTSTPSMGSATTTEARLCHFQVRKYRDFYGV
jgi:hypothetical protein